MYKQKMAIAAALAFYLVMAVSFVSFAEDRWVCQECIVGMFPHYDTIYDAIQAADPGDVIKIHAERTLYNPDEIYVYVENEPLIIDKSLTIIAPTQYQNKWPVVTIPTFSMDDDVITIAESGAGSVISNLEIRGPMNNNTEISGVYPIDCMDQRVGIRLEANDCLIDNCRITFCMTGIYLASTIGTGGTGNIISNCTIGDRWWYKPSSGDHEYEEYWTTSHDLTPIAYPGNGFGIVMVEPTWNRVSGEVYLNRSPNQVVDCIVRSNRYYGIVLTNGSQAQIAHNIIAWNGDMNPEVSADIPDETGGLLSLFTADQIQNNDNQIQAPIILSNAIYGNKGYQVGIMTESDSLYHIYNSPILIANTIGIEMGLPFVPEINGVEDNYRYLVCCGPTPSITATPTAIPGNPTNTPRVPGEFDYDYHGSGPVIAWNNLHDRSEMDLGIYHPLQRNNVPPRHTFTPTPSQSYPTSIPTSPPSTSIPFVSTFSPTPIPWSPSPTPVTPMPTFSPAPMPYDIDSPAWVFRGITANPRHDGWKEDPNRVPPRYYDWHIRDFTTSTPSQCFEKGGLILNPGSTRTDTSRDTGCVDMGRHIDGMVPTIESFTATHIGSEYLLEWEQPVNRPDGSVFDLSDVGGYVILCGFDSGPGSFTGGMTIIGEPVFLPAYETSHMLSEMSVGKITHLGIYIYDVFGMESAVTWVEKPE
ncbi:right-handed parallel beta-helix repeat-containing protein [bacterium]|nr:right-handed parallel beta-helix repeat-containing protein [candidate division CSSED10-310 bacterium]